MTKLPGFTAEQTAGSAAGHYRTNGFNGAPGGSLTIQQDGADSTAEIVGGIIGAAVGGGIGGAIASGIADFGGVIQDMVKAALDYIAKHTPCAGGQLLGSEMTRSVCGDDGYWHVIGYSEYMCPDGTVQFIDTYDQKTLQPCPKAKG